MVGRTLKDYLVPSPLPCVGKFSQLSFNYSSINNEPENFPKQLFYTLGYKWPDSTDTIVIRRYHCHRKTANLHNTKPYTWKLEYGIEIFIETPNFFSNQYCNFPQPQWAYSSAVFFFVLRCLKFSIKLCSANFHYVFTNVFEERHFYSALLYQVHIKKIIRNFPLSSQKAQVPVPYHFNVHSHICK